MTDNWEEYKMSSDIPFSCVETKLSSSTFEERFWKVLKYIMYTVLAL